MTMRKKYVKQDRRLFFKYVIPSMFSMLLAGVYTLVDGIFVGWGAGPVGLAALNVAFPASLFLLAVADMLGTGFSILLSISRGKKCRYLPDRIFSTLVSILVPVGILLPLALMPMGRFLLGMMGANETLMGGALEYWRITVGGGFFIMTTVGLVAVMRNDRAPGLAMGIMAAGLVANIVLDYLFVIVWNQGVAGSGWATIISQAICSFLALLYFLSGKTTLRFHPRGVRPVGRVSCRALFAGFPSFGLQITGAAVVLLHNRQTLAYGGVDAVAAYAVVSSVEPAVMLLLQGIASGSQPILSHLYGAGEWLRQRLISRYAVLFALSVGMAGMLFSGWGRMVIPSLFHLGGATFEVASRALLLTAPVYPLMGFLVISEACFQAVGRHRLASLLIYGDVLVLLPATLILLPKVMGLDGVWLAMPGVKFALCLLTLFFWRQILRPSSP